MASLVTIPEEILTSIISLASAGSSPSPSSDGSPAHCAVHYNLSLTCKHLHFITRPLLYGSIALPDNDLCNYLYDVNFIEPHRNYRLLTRTLCESPHLRHAIRFLSVHRCRSSPCVGMETPAFRAALRIAARAGQCGEVVTDAHYDDCQAAYIAILILLAPSLVSILVDEPRWDENCYRYTENVGSKCLEKALGMLIHTLDTPRSQGSLRGLGTSALRTLVFHDVSPVTLKKAMVAPSLRKLEASFINPRPGAWQNGPEIFLARSSGVTSLVLSDSMVWPDWALKIIRSCRSLESLRYELVSAHFGPNGRVIDLGALRSALDDHRTSLKTLQIINSVLTSYEEYSPGTTLGSLADYKVLVHLEMDAKLLGSLDLLPVGLKKLTLHTYEHANNIPILLSRLEELQARMLKELTITCPIQGPQRRFWKAGDGLNAEYYTFLDKYEPMVDRGQDIFVTSRRGEWMCHAGMMWDRMEVQLRDLQRHGRARLEDIAETLKGCGIMHAIKSQVFVPQIWTDDNQDTVFGRALMDVLEEEELDQKGAIWQSMRKYAEENGKEYQEWEVLEWEVEGWEW